MGRKIDFELLVPIAWIWVSNYTRACIIEMNDECGGWVTWYWDYLDDPLRNSEIYKSQLRAETGRRKAFNLYFRDETRAQGKSLYLYDLVH